VLLIVFGKEILVYEYGLVINKESILVPGVIIFNKPPDNNEMDHKNIIKPLLIYFSLDFQ
jgi:hypothetical protein